MHAQSIETETERDEAVVLLNHLKYVEASAALRAVLLKAPNDFYAYSLLWTALSHTEDAKHLKPEIEGDIELLRRLPTQDRTEQFFGAYEDGLQRLGKTEEVSKVHKQAIIAFPNGRAAQNAFFNQIDQERDPVKRVLLCEGFMKQFSNAKYLVPQAERKKFEAMSASPKLFSLALLIKAAAEWDASERVIHPESDPDISVVSALYRIAETFVQIAPKSAIQYETQALQYIAVSWPNTDNFHEDYGAEFLPLELQSRINDQQWESARRVASVLLPYLERGALSDVLPLGREQEAGLRDEVGLSLERCGDLEGAFLQYGIAYILLPERALELSAFIASHHQFDLPMDDNKLQWRANVDMELKNRRVQIQRKIEAQQTHIKAASFRLKSLSGDTVSLSRFSGQPLVLVFWASWCHFCSQELDELASLSSANANSRFAVVAVSVDTDQQAARDFIRGKNLTFPVVFSDGTVDAIYHAETIPKMLVIDPEGYIRFQLTGTDSDFASSLGIMLKEIDVKSGS